MAEGASEPINVNKIKKLPAWFWVGAAGVVAIGIYFMIRNRGSSGGTPTSGTDISTLLNPFQTDIDSLKKSISDFQTTINTVIQTEQTDVAKINTTITAIETKLSNLTGTIIPGIQAALKAAQDSLASLTASLNQTISQGNANAANIALLQQALQNVLAQLNQRVSNLVPADLMQVEIQQAAITLEAAFPQSVRNQIAGGNHLSFDQIVNYVKTHDMPSWVVNNPQPGGGISPAVFWNLLKSLVQINGQWTLPVNTTPFVLPTNITNPPIVPILPPYQPPKPAPAP